jgi:hypothetical protein
MYGGLGDGLGSSAGLYLYLTFKFKLRGSFMTCLVFHVVQLTPTCNYLMLLIYYADASRNEYSIHGVPWPGAWRGPGVQRGYPPCSTFWCGSFMRCVPC